MQPILTHLELLDKDLPGLKERLFDWIVDLDQQDFDQLCSEIIGLCGFRQKYEGALVTDQLDIIRPFLAILPKVELVIEVDTRHYDRRPFYRWLSEVNENQLVSICQELEAVCDQALENANAYVVARIGPALSQTGACWRIEPTPAVYLPGIFAAITSWRQ